MICSIKIVGFLFTVKIIYLDSKKRITIFYKRNHVQQLRREFVALYKKNTLICLFPIKNKYLKVHRECIHKTYKIIIVHTFIYVKLKINKILRMIKKYDLQAPYER